jgi:proteasome lid subunit RPN8/RPN11
VYLSDGKGEWGERMPIQRVLIERQVVDSLLTYSRLQHPREGILLLRGRKKHKDVLHVESVVIPPNAVHGDGFSSFSWNMLPIDLSFVGVAHSHPSGHAVPSQQDLLHATGRVMVIVGYPYSDDADLRVYDLNGRELPFEVV